ncbi:MAG: LysE family translocator [Pseudomonadota bacterium]|nr:LysE family translocator [Pseudomonadota bacterium]
MGLASLLLAWSALALAVSVTPGPDTLLVMGHSARGGVRAGLAAIAGIVTGGLWYMLLLGLGLLSLLNASPTVFLIVKTVGAVYLAWLGAKLIVGAVKRSPQAAPGAARLGAPYRQGLLTNALNPKVALFYLAALPQFVGTGPQAPLLGMLLIGIHYLIGGAWLSVVALGAASTGAVIRESNLMRWIEGVLGAVFIGLAGKLALSRS